ncbi:unnamed protein product [Didymodactylos carnosus]|uniref:ECT2 n=1 Tax=Didymodactylos carnosus TaxID=1234261 RepID=A0A8S2LEE0_9BILA|nr:unnamed protein product [Didymodactylos carnosus]CAF3901802.1 unnamed protein product [Didymodactylos carnosus]
MDWFISFYVTGNACRNTDLIDALDHMYPDRYKCITDRNELMDKIEDSKQMINNSLNQRQMYIFIVDSFDNDDDYLLKRDQDLYIISSELVSICVEKKKVRKNAIKDVPVPKLNRPLYCEHLSSTVICFVAFRDQDKLQRLCDYVHYLGGSVRKDYSDQITHVVAHANLGEKYLTAFNMERSEIVTEEFITNCWQERNNRLFDHRNIVEKYRTKSFHNLRLFFYGFTNDDDRKNMEMLTVQNGGYITSYLTDATHIVISDDCETSFTETYPDYVKQPRQYCVIAQWFWECILLVGKADESAYRAFPRKNQDISIQNTISPSITFCSTPPTSQSQNITRKRRGQHNQFENSTITPHKRRSIENNLENNNSYNNMFISPMLNLSKSLNDDGSPDKRKKDNRCLSIMELYETERNYVMMLKNIISIYKTEVEKESDRNGPILNPIESSFLFGNSQAIYDLHIEICSKLEQLITLSTQSVGTIFIDSSVKILKVYEPYTKFYDKTVETIRYLEKTNTRFYAYLKIAQHRPELGKQQLVDLMIRPVQRLPSILLLLERVLKYTPSSHVDHEPLNKAIDIVKNIARKLNEERGKTENQVTMFTIVNNIDNCPITKVRNNSWKAIKLTTATPPNRTGTIRTLTKTAKAYKHVVLVRLNTVKTLFNITSSLIDNEINDQLGMVCSIDGLERHLLFTTRIGDTLPLVTKNDILQTLAKTISEEKCLTNTTTLIQTIDSSELFFSSSILTASTTSLSSLEYSSSINSNITSISSRSSNVLTSVMKRCAHKVNKRLSRALSFSPSSSTSRMKKSVTQMLSSPFKPSNINFDSMKRLSIPYTEDSCYPSDKTDERMDYQERDATSTPLVMQSIKENCE